MVFQSYALYPHMTVKENLAFGLKLRKVPKDEIDRRVNEAAAILDLAKLLARKPKELSGGQRQRVALGRAIVREPAVFLMDEPLSNLDAKLRVQTRAQILRLHARLKTTVVYVTHDQVEAMTMGTRIAVMSDGKLQQVGTPQELYDLPVNRFVAGFIGSPAMNLLEATVDGRHVKAGDITIEISDARAKELEGRTSVTIGFRPEHLEFGKAEKGAAQIELTADVVEYLGAQELLHFSTKSGEVLALIGSEHKTPRGTRVQLSLSLEKLHLFDSATGAAIR
jgi:multiple sugar transport system ATP-binding protein